MKHLIVSLLIFLLLSLNVQAEDLKIGTTLSLSGAYATYGTNALHGIEMAVDEVNASGGVNGRKVKLIVEDEGTLDLRRAATAAMKLISLDKVEILLPLIVEDSEVIIPYTTKAPMFTMVVGCGARKCGFNLGKFNVRAPSSHDLIIDKLIEHAKTLNISKPCVVAAESTYFEPYGHSIQTSLEKLGMHAEFEGVPLSNSEDYRDIATRFRAKQCDAIFAWIPMGSIGSFFRRVREGGSKAQLFGIVESDDPQVLTAAGPAAEGVVFARFSLGSRDFQERYFKLYGTEPSRPAVPAYDGVKVLLETIAKVGTEPNALREAIIKINGHPATNGIVTFTPEGERIGEDVQLMKISDGKPIEIKASQN